MLLCKSLVQYVSVMVASATVKVVVNMIDRWCVRS